MSFRPLHDRVLVRRVEAEEKTAGGIIIPDSAKEKPAEGEIVSVGEGIRDDDGDRIAHVPLEVGGAVAGQRLAVACHQGGVDSRVCIHEGSFEAIAISRSRLRSSWVLPERYCCGHCRPV